MNFENVSLCEHIGHPDEVKRRHHLLDECRRAFRKLHDSIFEGGHNLVRPRQQAMVTVFGRRKRFLVT